MPWISLPQELALPHLIDLQGVSPPLRDRLAEVQLQFAQGDPEAVPASAERCYGMAKRGFDRYGEALALVLLAEAYRRLAFWEDGLDAIRHALRRLELQVAPVCRYNEALTVYLEGVIHFTLHSRARTVQTFAYAQHLLAESEHTWGREGHAGRVADCRNVVRWMAQLLDIQETLQARDCVAVLPVYEIVNRALIRTDALAVRASSVVMPAEALMPYLPSRSDASRRDALAGDVLPEGHAACGWGEGDPDALPMHVAVLPFPYLDPAASYVAVRAPVGETAWGEGRKGECLIIEVTGAGEPVGERGLISDVPFVRRGDGRIAMKIGFPEATDTVWPEGGGFVGIPRVLIREGDQR
jgi:hypothetical protein